MANASHEHAASTRCYAHKASAEAPGFFQNGDPVFQIWHVGWILCGLFTIAACIVSFWLVNKHLVNYTNKRHQRFVVRLLFMVPIYAVVSFASFVFWNFATPLILFRDAYEATVLTSFFYLLLYYVGNPEEQRITFLKQGISLQADAEALRKGLKPPTWMFPLGWVKSKPADGLYFLQLMKWGVLQYCVIKPLTTLAAMVLNYMGLYCEESWGPGWGHLWITLLVSISVTIAMYCLIQIYMPVKTELAPYRPLLKLFAVKAVVFLTFWQATALSGLSMLGVVKDTKYMTAADINIGFGGLLQCFEMMLFAFLHVKAFSYKPYKVKALPGDDEPEPTPRWKSLGHAFDFRETFREIWQGCIYMMDRLRKREPRHDYSARRIAHMESAFGRARPSHFGNNEKPAQRTEVSVEEMVEDDAGERQWLGHGDDYGYGIGYQSRREKSEGLEQQITTELQRRGYGPGMTGRERIAQDVERTPVKHVQERSWWRNIYNRGSQPGSEPPHSDRLSPGPRRVSRSKRKGDEIRLPVTHEADVDRRALLREYDYEDDEPPRSAIREYNSRPRTIRPYQEVGYQPQRYPERAFPSMVSPSTTELAASSFSNHTGPVAISHVRTIQPIVEVPRPEEGGYFSRAPTNMYQNIHMSPPLTPPVYSLPAPSQYRDDYSIPLVRSPGTPSQSRPVRDAANIPRMSSPPVFPQRGYSSPGPNHQPGSPTSPGGLRRAQAHRYSNEPAPRKSTVQPVMPPLLGPSIPQPSYPGQSANSRRTSVPAASPPAMPRSRQRDSMDDSPSTFVEPSRSRTGVFRYPTRGSDGKEKPRGVSGSSYSAQPSIPTDRVQNVGRRPW